MKILRKVFFIGLCALIWSGLSKANGEFTQWLFGDRIAECDCGSEKLVKGFETFSKNLVWGSRAHFLARNLILFDATIGAKQCHINAFIVVRLAQDDCFREKLKKLTTVAEILDADDGTKLKIKFLALNLLLSFVTAGGNRACALDKLLNCETTGAVRKAIRETFKDPHGLIPQAKLSFLAFLERFFDAELVEFVGEKKWEQIGIENRALGKKTLPDFPGIWCLIQKLKQLENIWTVVICEKKSTKELFKFLITPDQERIVSFSSDDLGSLFKKFKLSPQTPVIVIGGTSTVELPEKELLSFNEHGLVKMQLAIAAASMGPMGECFVPEMLREVFDESLMFADHHGILSDLGPHTFFIQHMFPDTLGRAMSMSDRGDGGKEMEEKTKRQIINGQIIDTAIEALKF